MKHFRALHLQWLTSGGESMRDIDGLVSKDNLYRLMLKLRLQGVITEEQAGIICEEIAEMPFEEKKIIFPRGANRFGYLRDYEFELRKIHEDDEVIK